MDAKRELEKAREELEKSVKRNLKNLIMESQGRQINDYVANNIAQAILDRLPEMGFVRLEDVQIDVNELTERLMVFKIHTYSYEWTRREYKKLAHAIASAKGILRVKK